MQCFGFLFLPLLFYWVLWGVFIAVPMNRSERSTSDPATSGCLDAPTRLQIQEIEDRIQELEEKKRGYLALALRHTDQAERLQFVEHRFLEAKRHMELADENLKIADEIQQEIDCLKKGLGVIQKKFREGDGFEDL